MKKTFLYLTTTVWIALLCAPAVRSSDHPKGLPLEKKPERISRPTAKALIGKEVTNDRNVALGSVSELVVDGSGVIRFLILEHGGAFGIGARMIPIPWEAVHIRDGRVFVDVDRSKLNHAPSFPNDQWPNFTNRRWVEGFTTITASNLQGR